MKNRDELMTYLHKATNVPFYVLNIRTGIIFTHVGTSLEEMATYVLDTYQAAACDRDHPLLLSEGSIFYCAMMELNENSYLMLGPVCPTRYRESLLRGQLNGIISAQTEEVLDLLVHGPVVLMENLQNIICLAARIVDDRPVRTEDICIVKHEQRHAELGSAITNLQFTAAEQMEQHVPKSYEDMLFDAVRRGDRIMLQMYQSEPSEGHIGKMSDHPVRQERYRFITAASLLCRAVIEGGLEEEIAYSISDAYCQQMDRMPDGADFGRLYMGMINEYINCMKEMHQPESQTSTMTARVKDYVSKHIQEPFSIRELAEYCGLSKGYLARRFREENGISLTAYIQQSRLGRACQLLKYSDFTISGISNILQYSSQSYFTEQFKHQYHITPKKYRDLYGPKK